MERADEPAAPVVESKNRRPTPPSLAYVGKLLADGSHSGLLGGFVVGVDVVGGEYLARGRGLRLE